MHIIILSLTLYTSTWVKVCFRRENIHGAPEEPDIGKDLSNLTSLLLSLQKQIFNIVLLPRVYFQYHRSRQAYYFTEVDDSMSLTTGSIISMKSEISPSLIPNFCLRLPCWPAPLFLKSLVVLTSSRPYNHCLALATYERHPSLAEKRWKN
jgi:hypothetical protein